MRPGSPVDGSLFEDGDEPDDGYMPDDGYFDDDDDGGNNESFDLSDDADALASAGHGMDEDYPGAASDDLW